jgi:hypothetical protein
VKSILSLWGPVKINDTEYCNIGDKILSSNFSDKDIWVIKDIKDEAFQVEGIAGAAISDRGTRYWLSLNPDQCATHVDYVKKKWFRKISE